MSRGVQFLTDALSRLCCFSVPEEESFGYGINTSTTPQGVGERTGLLQKPRPTPSYTTSTQYRDTVSVFPCVFLDEAQPKFWRIRWIIMGEPEAQNKNSYGCIEAKVESFEVEICRIYLLAEKYGVWTASVKVPRLDRDRVLKWRIGPMEGETTIPKEKAACNAVALSWESMGQKPENTHVSGAHMLIPSGRLKFSSYKKIKSACQSLEDRNLRSNAKTGLILKLMEQMRAAFSKIDVSYRDIPLLVRSLSISEILKPGIQEDNMPLVASIHQAFYRVKYCIEKGSLPDDPYSAVFENSTCEQTVTLYETVRSDNLSLVFMDQGLSFKKNRALASRQIRKIYKQIQPLSQSKVCVFIDLPSGDESHDKYLLQTVQSLSLANKHCGYARTVVFQDHRAYVAQDKEVEQRLLPLKL